MARLLLIGLLLAQANNSEAWQLYEIVDLGSLRNDDNAVLALSINNHSTIVGYTSSLLDDDDWAFRWNPSTGMMRLDSPFGFGDATAWSVNDNGVAVGQARSDAFLRSAVTWNQGGSPTILLSSSYDLAWSINSQGTVAGQSGTSVVDPIATLWDNAIPQLLGTPSGFTASTAYGISDTSKVVGKAWNQTMGAAYFFDPTNGFTVIAEAPISIGIEATAVNNNAVVVGHIGIEAFRWDQSNGLQILPSMGTRTVANAINSAGHIVGVVVDSANNPFGSSAALWTDAGFTDINALPLVNPSWDHLTAAYDINDRGEIVGRGMLNGQDRAFLMRPVQESKGVIGVRLEDFQASGVLSYQYQGGETTFGSSGVFRLQTEYPVGALASLVGPTAFAFCIELSQSYTSSLEDYFVGDLTSANSPLGSKGPITLAQRDLVAQLWALHFESSWIAAGPYSPDDITRCMAFHASILEILSDFDGLSLSSIDLEAGDFKLVNSFILDVNDPSQELQVRMVANSFLSSLSTSYTGRLPRLLALTNGQYQDYLVEAVPESPSIVLVISGLMALYFFGPRQRQ